MASALVALPAATAARLGAYSDTNTAYTQLDERIYPAPAFVPVTK